MRARALELPKKPSVALAGKERVAFGYGELFRSAFHRQDVHFGVRRQADEEPRLLDARVEQRCILEGVTVNGA